MPKETSTRVRIVSGRHAASTMSDAATAPFEALGWAFRGIWMRRRLKKLLRAAGEASPIASLDEGLVRITGRIETLDPVSDDRGRGVAAYIRRASHDAACGCDKRCTVIERFVETQGNAGRFLVRDDNGVALVEGPQLRLLDYHGRPLDSFEAGRLTIHTGDAVTVLGVAKRELTDEPRARVTNGYRGTVPTPIFRSDPDHPIYVFCPTD